VTEVELHRVGAQPLEPVHAEMTAYGSARWDPSEPLAAHELPDSW
jgi:hypothetical protein